MPYLGDARRTERLRGDPLGPGEFAEHFDRRTLTETIAARKLEEVPGGGEGRGRRGRKKGEEYTLCVLGMRICGTAHTHTPHRTHHTAYTQQHIARRGRI